MSSKPRPAVDGSDLRGRKYAVLIGVRTYPAIPPQHGSPLGGCHNDVARMRESLLTYGFRSADIRVLIDRLDSCRCPFCSGEVASTTETPTREGIRRVVSELSSNLEAEDQAVIYFSGHGSEIAGGGLHSGQRFQTLVPHDSGRGDATNRDITDWEIEGWIRALGRRTRFATLIFDCCHSGGVTDLRSGDPSPTDGAIRRVQPDTRSDPEDYDSALRAQLRRHSDQAASSVVRATRGQGPSQGLGSPWRGRGGRRSVVVLASSAAHELSRETVDEQGRRQGLFTHHLTRSLQHHGEDSAASGLRWSDVFPEVARRVRAENLAQNPHRRGDGPVFAPGAIDPDDVDPPEVIELEKLAVVVGIDYQEQEEGDAKSRGFSPLRTPHHDAREIARVLRDVQGYTLVGLSAKSPEPLLGRKATRDRIHRVLQRLAAVKTKTFRETAVVLYFAGHGVVRTENDGQHTGYLIPWGADPEDPATWLPMKDLRDQLVDGISDPDRLAAMGQRKPLQRLTSRHLLVVLDCCFGGALAFDFFRSAGPPDRPIYYSEYRRFVEGNAWQMLTSASHNQQALDRNPSDPEQLHSPFAQALVEALTTDGADGGRRAAATDRILTASEIHQYVDRRLDEMGVDLQSPGLMALRPLRGQFVFYVPGYRPSPLPDPPLDPASNPWRQIDPSTWGPGQETSTDGVLWGREGEILDLLHHFLEVRHRPEIRGLLLLGPSASGRTTLVEVGLRPILDQPDRERRRLVAWLQRQQRHELLLTREDLKAVRRWIEERQLGPDLDAFADSLGSADSPGPAGPLGFEDPLGRADRSQADASKKRVELAAKSETVAQRVRHWAREVGLGGGAREILESHHQREQLGVPSFSAGDEQKERPWLRRLRILELLDTPEILCRRLHLWRTRHGLADFVTVSDRALRSLVGRWRWVTDPDDDSAQNAEEEVILWLDPLEDRVAEWTRGSSERLWDRAEIVLATAGSQGFTAWRELRKHLGFEGPEGESRWRIVHASHPDRETLRTLAHEPAAARVLAFDPPELIETLVESVVGTAAPLPLLSETLGRMFDRAWTRRGRDGRTLTTADLPEGGIWGWQARRAEQLRDELNRRDPQLPRTLRRLILRTIRIEGETVRRRPVSWRELDLDHPEEQRRLHEVVIPSLVRARLAVVGPETLELVSDALLGHWSRLRRALTTLRRRSGSTRIRRLRSLWGLWRRASEWRANDFDSDSLWPQGPDLMRLLTAPGLNRLERGFVVASEVERRRHTQDQLAMLATREVAHDWPKAALVARAATRLALDSRNYADRVLRTLGGPERLAELSEVDRAVIEQAIRASRALHGASYLRVIQCLHDILSVTPFSIPWSVGTPHHLRGLGFRDPTTLMLRLGSKPLDTEPEGKEAADRPSPDERLLVWDLSRPDDTPRIESLEGDSSTDPPAVASGRVVPRPRGPLDPGEDFPTVGGPRGPRAQSSFDASVRFYDPLPVPLPPPLVSWARSPKVLLGHRRVPTFLAFSPDRRWLATASDRRSEVCEGIEIRIWPWVEGSLRRHPQGLPETSLDPEDLSTSVVDRFPGRLVLGDRVVEVARAARESQPALVLTDPETGNRHELSLGAPAAETAESRPERPPRWPPPPPWQRRGLREARADPTGRWLAALLHTGEAQLWQADSGTASFPTAWRQVASTGESDGPRSVRCLAFAPAGREEVLLAAASDSGRLWFLESGGSWRAQSPMAVGSPTDLVWGEEGRPLALGFRDGSVRLWMEGRVDPDEQPLLFRDPSLEGFAVRRLTLGPAGDWLKVVRRQTHEPFAPRVDLYRLDPEILVELARGHAGRELDPTDLPSELWRQLSISGLDPRQDESVSRASPDTETEIESPGPTPAYWEALGLEAGSPAKIRRSFAEALSRWKPNPTEK